MATLLMRWLVAWTVCAFAVTKVTGDGDETPFHTETEGMLKKRIMEEETLVKFLSQLTKLSQRFHLSNNRRSSAQAQGAAKRIGSEFLGKRESSIPTEQKEDITVAAILANQLLNYDTTRKRLGSEFLGKRDRIGSEFLGKRDRIGSEFPGKKSYDGNVDQSTERVTIEEDPQGNSNFNSK